MIEGRPIYANWWSKSKLADVIVFDLDGTLVDSDNANLLSYEAAAMNVLSRQVQINVEPGVRITRETLSELIPGIRNEQLKAIVMQKESMYQKYLSKTIVNVQLLDIIENSKNKKIILATNSRRLRADMLLDHHGLTDKFVKKFYRDAVNPRDKYIRFIPEIRKEGKSIVVFENDADAIESAIKCGIKYDQIINVCRSECE